MPHYVMKLRLALPALLFLFSIRPALADGLASRGGDGKSAEIGNCIPLSQQVAAMRTIKAYEAKVHGPTGPKPAVSPYSQPGKKEYPFYPQAGILWKDIFPNNFVDEDPTAGILDYACSDYTYDGHQGIDSDIVTWTQKNIGVPIYAALQGTVIATADGNFDQQTVRNGSAPANYVILDHGGTQHTWYWHMKSGSVAVQAGDVVKAGQQLGLTASSGDSTGPHLHFESRFADNYFEPFSGSCGAASSNWLTQPAFDRSLYLREFNITTDDLDSWTLPNDTSRTGYFLPGIRAIHFWLVAQNFPAGSSYAVRFLRPDSSVRYSDSGLFGNPFYRWSYWWFEYDINFDVLGTWKLELSINGNVVVSAPFQVISSLSSAVNRAPNAMTSLAFTPLAPTIQDAVRCTVGTSLVLRDADYDQVSYRYVWKLNNITKRDVTIAAISDIFPAETATAGVTLTCTVTPTDGKTNGQSLVRSYVYPGHASAENWTIYH